MARAASSSAKSIVLGIHIELYNTPRTAGIPAIFNRIASIQLIAEHFYKGKAEARCLIHGKTFGKPPAVVLYGESYLVFFLGQQDLYRPAGFIGKGIFHCIGKKLVDNDPEGKQRFRGKSKVGYPGFD